MRKVVLTQVSNLTSNGEMHVLIDLDEVSVVSEYTGGCVILMKSGFEYEVKDNFEKLATMMCNQSQQ